MSKQRLSLFLGDLGHYTVGLMNNVIPLNIGYLAAYLDMSFPGELEIRLFKRPEELLDAIEALPPDILGLSHYVWNRAVSERAFQVYKALKPDGLTVWGGPNFTENEPQKSAAFLRARQFVDFVVPFEGELGMRNLVGAALSKKPAGPMLREAAAQGEIDGVSFIRPDGTYHDSPGLRIEDLDSIPSPFLAGYMDPFLKQGLNPIIETQRGCPFKCAYCHTAAEFFTKVRHFSLPRIFEDVNYLVKQLPDPKRTSLVIADTNFGMYEKDLLFAEFLERVYRETGFPFRIDTSTGKAAHERILKTVNSCTKLSLTMGIQTLDDQVLKEIKRINLSFEKLKDFHRQASESSKISTPEIILGLPLETRDSHIRTLRLLINEIQPSMVTQFTAMLLPGTWLYTDEARTKHQYTTRFRLIPTGFGDYRSEKRFETEEVCVATKDLTFADYLDMRALFFCVNNIYGNRIFHPLVRTLQRLGIDVVDFLMRLVDRRPRWPVFEGYLSDTQRELFETREAAEAFYAVAANYEKLKDGLIGVNLAHVYKSRVLLGVREWADLILNEFGCFVTERTVGSPPGSQCTQGLVDDVAKHVRMMAGIQHDFMNGAGIPSATNPRYANFSFDVIEPPSLDKLSSDPSATRIRYYMNESSHLAYDSLKQLTLPFDKAIAILRGDPASIFPICERVVNDDTGT